MAWTLAEQAEFAALKRHKLCLLLGDGCAMKGLARLLLVERQVERRLDSELRRKQTAPRARTSAECGAAAPNRAAAPAAKAECAGRAQRRRPATAARKARAAARLLVFQAAKRKQLARHKLRAALRTALQRHRWQSGGWQRMWDVFTAYKIGALFDAHHAERNREIAHFLFVDVDAFVRSPLDERFWAFTRACDVATIARERGLKIMCKLLSPSSPSAWRRR